MMALGLALVGAGFEQRGQIDQGDLPVRLDP
jgi:hypothetical protein